MSEAPEGETRPISLPPAPAKSSILRRTLLQKKRKSLDGPQVTRFKDHFSLQTPTSTVRFQDKRSAARVICNQNSQLVLEEIYDQKQRKRQITIKRVKEESSGFLRLLRATYVLFSAFMFGFLLVLSIQVIFFIILDLAIVLGQTDLQKAQPLLAIGALFSLPLIIDGLSCCMMMAGTFLRDTWEGHYLFNKFVFPSLQSYLVEWVFFFGFLGVPLLVMAGYLISKNDDWWENTSFFWFLIIFSFFLVFVLNVLWYEARIFFRVIHDSDVIDDHDSMLRRFYACVLLRQRYLLSGFSRTRYTSFGSPEGAIMSDDAPDQASKSRNYMVEGTLSEDQRGAYTRLTQCSILNHGRCKLFEKLERPRRILTIEEVIQRRPYLTAYTWSLEKYFCKPTRSRYIGIIAGPGALTKSQIVSTFVCSLLGLFLVYLLLASILVYHGSTGRVAACVITGIVILSLPAVIQPIKLYFAISKHRRIKSKAKEDRSQASLDNANSLGDRNKQIHPSDDSEASEKQTDGKEEVLKNGSEQVIEAIQDSEKPTGSRQSSECVKTASEEDLEWAGFGKEEEETSTGIYFVVETFRVTEPSVLMSSIVFVVQAFLFVIWPTISLYTIEDAALSTLFLGIALSSTIRYLTDSEVLLEELGGLSAIPSEQNEAQNWATKSRLSEVTASVGKGQSYYGWRIFYSLFTLLCLLFGGIAIGATLESKQVSDYAYVPGFHYEPQNSVQYASCTFDKNANQVPARPMSDYVFLAMQAYRVDNRTGDDLIDWFGSGNVVDRSEIADSFRRSDKLETTAAFYKLFSYETNNASHAVVSIRGTQNAWDFLADFQLWGASISLQLVRSALPFGHVYTTQMLHRVSHLLSNLQSGTIEKVSFFRSTTSFVRYVQDSGNYSSVAITGHSLGGGLALISGAQTGVQAVGISAPNVLISRRRFDITPGDIERFTFNVIPDRDIVPMTDDPAKTVQRIECRAPRNKRMGCHSVQRSLCEIMYTCGSGSRPVICECVYCMGYPEPTPNANTTISFQEACQDMKPCP